MADAFEMFAPYADVPKVTIFGSARTQPDDPTYAHTVEVARQLAAHGWMVVTGAGPGIMEAGMLGAGRKNSIGVSIRLPFETDTNPVIAGDDKHVAMKYFFTRKLMLVKESAGFISLPGGFGTLDETFELLTLNQTGKGIPAPVVLLDTPGDSYWADVDRFIREVLITRGLVSEADTSLYTVTDSCQQATEVITGFYANYHSIRRIGDDLVIRLRRAPTDAQLAELNERFGHLVSSGVMRRTSASAVEQRQHDAVEMERIVFHFNQHAYAELHDLIRALNALGAS